MNSVWLSIGGLTLVHFLWQGATVAVVLALILWAIPVKRADIRYVLALSGLTALALCPLVTFGWIVSQVQPLLTTSHPAGVITVSTVKAFLYGSQPRPVQPQDFLPYLVLIWGFGVIALALRLLAGLWRVQTLTTRGNPADTEWQEKLATLAKRFGMSKPIKLLTSDEVDAPATTGVFKSVVIVPVSILAKMPTDAMEALLLHELAHIRRHDYLVNVIQTVVETVLFYHPAVWWVSHLVRAERENCCDDMAVRALGSDIRYAKALTLLEEHRMSWPMLPVSAAGGHLMKRVQRILGLSSPQKIVSPTVPAAILVVGLALAMGGTVMAQNPPAAPKPVTAKHHAKPPVAPKALTAPGQLSAPTPPTKGLGPFGPAPSDTKPLSLPEKVADAPPALTPDSGALSQLPAPDAKIPVLGDLPIIGRLFQDTKPPVPPAAKVLSPAAPAAQEAGGGGFGGGSSAPAAQPATAQTLNSMGGGGFSGGGMGGGGISGGGGGFGGGGMGGGSPRLAPARPSNSQGMGGFGGGGAAAPSYQQPANLNSDGTVDVVFRNVPFDIAVQELAKMAKMSVVVMPGEYKPVTVILHQKAPDDVIRTLARCGNALATFDNGTCTLMPDRPGEVVDDGDLILEDAQFQKAALQLAIKYGISISVPSDAKFGNVTAKIGRVPLDMALQMICESSGATYHMIGNAYFFVPKNGH